MPVSYTKPSGQGHVYQVPDYPEAADGPKAFKDYSDFLDLILPPVGSIMPFAGNTAPTGWLLCNGGEFSSTTYPRLATVCGTKFGSASAGNFRVPDLRGRVIAGLDSSQTEFDTIGKTGGAKSVTLTVSNMPAHTHTATTSGLTASSAGSHEHTASTNTTGAHAHTMIFAEHFNTTTGGSQNRLANLGGSNSINNTSTAGNHSHTVTVSPGGDHTHTISGTVTIASTGNGTAVNTLNPYITMNHIIRAA